MIITFGIYQNKYVTLRPIKYKNIEIPSGFIFDGVSISSPFTILFSNKDLRQGIRASCFHDWLCQHKNKYSRKYATKILVDIWREDGLDNIKSTIAGICVNLYQWWSGWK